MPSQIATQVEISVAVGVFIFLNDVLDLRVLPLPLAVIFGRTTKIHSNFTKQREAHTCVKQSVPHKIIITYIKHATTTYETSLMKDVEGVENQRGAIHSSSDPPANLPSAIVSASQSRNLHPL